MPTIKACMICHTHWDREWYLTKNEFKTKMVRLVDSVLENVEQNQALSFMLDGQTIVLEDYLEIRPENRARLEKAIRSGRLCVGPWYILPDEILVSGESHIRNYLTGQRIAAEFGGGMNIGYLPDSFGHPEQMPQILSGLSMDTSIFWRGIPNQITAGEFRWQSAWEKAGVTAVNMPHGYGNSARLLADPAQTVPRLKAMMDQLAACTKGDVVLLMNGSDHILNQPDILSIIDEFNRTAGPDYQIRIGTMQSFLDELNPTLRPLDSWQGELRSGDRSMLLSGTMSTRVYLKQWNSRVQRGMERYLEPAAVLERLAGMCSGFAGYQKYLWRKILENHPHDSICGCSVDEVHSEMMTRFRCVQQLEKTLYTDTMNRLAARTGAEAPRGVQLLCFEPCQDGLPATVEVEADFDPMLVQRVNFAKSTIDEYEAGLCHPALPVSVTAIDAAGNPIPARLLKAEKAYYNHLQDSTAPEIYKVNRCRVALSLPSLPYGLSVITLLPGSEPQDTADVTGDAIENSHYIVRPDGKGAFAVTCKATGRSYTGVARLVDGGDAGDEYTYSWPVQDSVYTLEGAPAQVVRSCVPGIRQSLTIRSCLRLPRALSADRTRRLDDELTDNPVSITATLFGNANYLDLTVEFDNRAQDHRLQLEIPTGVLAEYHDASSAFAVTRRPVEITPPSRWMERLLPTYPTHGFVDVSGEEGGVSAVCEGIAEYQAENRAGETRLAITLLRCVGWLSRADLLTRRGNGGWCYETPEAQCQGQHRFHCAAVWHTGSWRQAGTFAAADRILHPPVLQAAFAPAGRLDTQNPLAFLSGLPGDVRLSACKPSEDGEGVVVRVYSLADRTRRVCLEGVPFAAAFRCRLDEQDRTPADYTGGRLCFDIEPGQILSFYLQ